jgi:hypothetical protein
MSLDADKLRSNGAVLCTDEQIFAVGDFDNTQHLIRVNVLGPGVGRRQVVQMRHLLWCVVVMMPAVVLAAQHGVALRCL